MARSRFNDPIEPMTLANMRANRIHSFAIYCQPCHHRVGLPSHTRAPSPSPSPTARFDAAASRPRQSSSRQTTTSRLAQDWTARSKDERHHSGMRSYLMISDAELRRDSSDDPNPDRIFHARWQHRGAGEPGGQGAISRSCASRSAGSAGGIGAAYLVATTIPSVRCSGSETRWEHKEVPAGFAIPRQEIARSDGAPMMTLPQLGRGSVRVVVL
jgi:hypothetical protein